MSLEKRIRLAERRDLQRLNEIYNWAVLNTVATFDLEERSSEQSEQWFVSHQNPFYPLYVVETAGNVSGWGSLSPFHPRAAYRLTGEFSIYLSPEYQGEGIGSFLLQHLCQCAEALGYHSLIGLITATNSASLGLAQKHGFLRVGHYHEVGQKFGKWLDVIAVQRTILEN
ncbi:GNAT family N-acetyltransferase [Desulfosporosinus sp. Sb-LF]|uniref:GNAT family N-acetyltransferase n=1 Tax=Desulfosporosinus sp. Sb-LF TaxID=2560027 RepID=UPI00107F9852|nr:GNAT family N-acetyltransferase [Desulfosporosinus sp. Sb-LF]TGE32348.1 N-acetyltransferase family protein [Desulfosporosinus sp. Sb-LF]